MIKNTCFSCGIEFIANSNRQLYCSPRCRRIMSDLRAKESMIKRIKYNKETALKSYEDIAIENEVAKKNKLSYGQYVALERLNNS